MFYETHHKMGQMMHDRIERLYPGKIQRDAFVYGNVKPDLLRKGAKDRHLLSDTLPFIELTAGFLCTPSYDPEEDAVLLGMVCHHVCDAFCRYHQELSLYRDYPRHLEYELGLNAYFLECLRNGLFLSDEGKLVASHVPDDRVSAESAVTVSAGGACMEVVPVQQVHADAKLVACAPAAGEGRPDAGEPEAGEPEADTAQAVVPGNRSAIQAVIPMMLRFHVRRAAYADEPPSFLLDLRSALEACAELTDAILAKRFLPVGSPRA